MRARRASSSRRPIDGGDDDGDDDGNDDDTRKRKRQSEVTPPTKTSAELRLLECESVSARCSTAIDILSELTGGSWFASPVDAEEVPDYYVRLQCQTQPERPREPCTAQ